jgi:hypothetical protein
MYVVHMRCNAFGDYTLRRTAVNTRIRGKAPERKSEHTS